MINEENVKPTQRNRVDWYIRKYGSITQLEALRDLGIMRLASRVSEMRKDGIEIKLRWKDVKNRFGENCQVKEYYYEAKAGAPFPSMVVIMRVNN